MANDRQAQIDAIKAKLIKQAVDKVWGETNKEHDVNFREVVGTIENKDGKEEDVKITSICYGKEEK